MRKPPGAIGLTLLITLVSVSVISLEMKTITPFMQCSVHIPRVSMPVYMRDMSLVGGVAYF